MARVCHTNNCPVGVASQREELRARFPGVPEDLVNYFHFVAEEVRAGLASMGLRSLDELVGRADYLKQRRHHLKRQQEAHDNGPQLDDEILADPAIPAAIENNGSVTKDVEIVNVDRSALARVAGAVALKHGDRGFKGEIAINLRGSAGQSFGCFLAGGMRVKLVGEANDYVGKGMAGGEISIVPPEESTFAPEKASIVGNTCLYGATGGRLFVGGRAGERFAVRNSMAETVVEGTGDHCCEYMTGGVVVALGPVGRNVGAGMTGGLGYFYDPEGTFPEKVNGEIVQIQRVQTEAGKTQLKTLIQDHVDRTGSSTGRAILDSFDAELQNFWQVVPPSEANTPEASPLAEEDSSVAVAA
eukprot:jgi/Picre1/28565/NNA_003967.t1